MTIEVGHRRIETMLRFSVTPAASAALRALRQVQSVAGRTSRQAKADREHISHIVGWWTAQDMTTNEKDG